tara:strand:+ start:102 stop:521 length:420 start_codon:yes stop_codon:yes gene_type:complete
MKQLNEFLNEGAFDKALKKKIKSVEPAYLSYDANMANPDEFIKVFKDHETSSFAQEEFSKKLIPILTELEKLGIKKEDIKIAGIPNGNYGWDVEDIEHNMTSSVIYITSKKNDKLLKIAKKHGAEEISYRNGIYRFWWD